MKNIRKRIWGPLIYLIFLFAVLEVFSRFFFSTIYGRRRLLERFDCDASWRLRYAKRHIPISQGVYYNYDAIDYKKGWSLRPNLRMIDAFRGKTLNSNSKGVRGEKEYTYEKSPDKKRILIMGDSFTFG